MRRDAKEIYDRETNKLIKQLDETSREILENLLITIEDDVINGCIKDLEYLYSEEGVSFIQARNLSFRAPFCAEIFLKHIWTVGLNTFGQEKAFYTSDNPVGKRPHYKWSGIESKGIEICFPLSSEVILILWEREYFKKGEVYEDRVIQLTKEQINHYNSIQVTSSDRFVYCRDNDFGFAEEIIKTSPYDLSSSRKRFKSKICWS